MPLRRTRTLLDNEKLARRPRGSDHRRRDLRPPRPTAPTSWLVAWGLLALVSCHPNAAAVSPAPPPTPAPAPVASGAEYATPAPSAEPPTPEDVARAVAFLAKLPRCTSDATRRAGDVETALAEGIPSTQSIHGRLVPGGGDCTLMRCRNRNGNAVACCNHCVGAWVVKSKDGTKSVSIETLVSPGGSLDDGLATWAVMDCHLGAFRAKAGAGVDVVVTGDAGAEPLSRLGRRAALERGGMRRRIYAVSVTSKPGENARPRRMRRDATCIRLRSG